MNGWCWYRQQEDKVISWITTNIWKPKRIGGSSIAKASLFIRAFFRFFLFAVIQFILILTGKLNYSLFLKRKIIKIDI